MPEENALTQEGTNQAAGTEGNSAEGASSSGEQNQNPIYWDNTQVPEHLRETHKAMQGELTKTQQKYGDLGKVVEKLGTVDEVTDFLARFTRPTGTIDWFKEVANNIGTDKVAEMLGIQAGSPSDDPQKGKKVESESGDVAELKEQIRQFQEYMQKTESEKENASQRSRIDRTFSELGVTNAKERKLIEALASDTPKHLELEDRVKRGHENYQAFLEEMRQAKAKSDEAGAGKDPDSIESRLPGILKGSTPLTAAGKPKTMEEAHKTAQDVMKQLRRMHS